MGGRRGRFMSVRSWLRRLRQRAAERRALVVLLARRDEHLLRDAGLADEAAVHGGHSRTDVRAPADGIGPERPRWLG